MRKHSSYLRAFTACRGSWGYSDRFFCTFSFLQAALFHIKYLKKHPFMQKALALQNHDKSFLPARTQSPEIRNFGNIFAVSE